MALAAEDKAVVVEVRTKLEEIETYIRTSIPLRSTGASHIFNQLLPLVAKLKALEVEA